MESINSVKVFSIDEERLKFRVIASFDANQITQHDGKYGLVLEPPTSFANSDHYQQCEIKLDQFTAATASGTGDPTWRADGNNIKVPACIVRLDAPSSQTIEKSCLTAASTNVGDTRIGGFVSVVSLVARDIGDNTGAFGGARARAWQGEGSGDGVKCGNPFGKSLTIQNIDAGTMKQCFLTSAGAPGADLGFYTYQFTITMIPNK
tara:strand:+ start:434 stop:1051 length:618 start_codon:yes stop_codon:yes gene_type:complete